MRAWLGWPCAEGTDGTCGTDPEFARRHRDGYSAIVGGYVVRDPGLPTLAGRYVYGDIAQPTRGPWRELVK